MIAPHTGPVKIYEVTEVSDQLVEVFARLIPQLSSSNPPPSRQVLAAIVASDSSHLLVAEDEGTIVGSLTLVVFPIPTGIRAWIEDVVVDDAARGKGVGGALNKAALAMARPVRKSIHSQPAPQLTPWPPLPAHCMPNRSSGPACAAGG